MRCTKSLCTENREGVKAPLISDSLLLFSRSLWVDSSETPCAIHPSKCKCHAKKIQSFSKRGLLCVMDASDSLCTPLSSEPHPTRGSWACHRGTGIYEENRKMSQLTHCLFICVVRMFYSAHPPDILGC